MKLIRFVGCDRTMKMSMCTLLLLTLSTAAWSLLMTPAAASATAEVQNDTMWLDTAGYLHVFGEVKNTGDVWLRFIRITGTLRDADGTIVDILATYTRLDHLPPNELSPFEVLVFDTAKSARIRTYSLALQFQEAVPFPVGLTLLSVADSKNALGWLEVVGEVQNNGDTNSRFTKVVGTFYDEASKVVYVDFTYTSPSEIQPGVKHAFKITVPSKERSDMISRYSLAAESQEYTSIPEWGWPTIVAGIALTLVVAVLRINQRRSAHSTAALCGSIRQAHAHSEIS